MVNSALNQDSTRESSAPGMSPTLSRLEQAFVTLISVISRLPFVVRSALGWLLGYAAGCVPSRDQKIGRAQIATFLHHGHPGLLIRSAFANAGATLFESLNLVPILKSHEMRISCPNWSSIEEWTLDERPIVALTAHTGNWDLLAAYMIHRGIPISTVGREARSRAAQHILATMRHRYGIETIWRSDRRAVRRLMECFKERRVVAALIDQDTRVDSSFVPFFGAPAKTPSSLISLGKRANARFVSAFLFRVGFLRYEIFAEEFPEGLREEEILLAFNKRLEGLIRRFPSQWVWFHKRWRSRADGAVLSSRDYLEQLRLGLFK